MRNTRARRLILFALAAVWVCPGNADGQSRDIDTNRSSLRIHVFKSGLFSVFGHNHEIQAPIDAGAVETSPHASVQLRVDARKLRVLDPDLPADKRAEIQQTMLGSQVLDSSRYSDITFQSTAVELIGKDLWSVRGTLTLHGRTSNVVTDVSLKGGRYHGSATLKQSSFGIEPVSVAGGTVRVKDEVRVEFDIVLLQ